jgi:putative ABC transport system permease protein
MIKHYFKIAIRNLTRQKMLALINVMGLSIGLACFTLFLLYAVHEFSFDRVHKNAANIYRTYVWWNFNAERSGSEPASTTPLGPAMKQDLPDVQEFVRWAGRGEHMVRVNDKIHQVNFSFADPQVFKVFTFPLVAGNAQAGLQDAHNIVLTKEKALQLFGNTNVVGQPLEIKMGDQYESFIVSAVAENIPANSTLRFDMLGSFNYILNSEDGKRSMADWNMTIGISVFVQLRPGSTLPKDAAKLASFRTKYFPDEKEFLLKEKLWNGKGNVPNGYGLQPLREVHTGVDVDKWSSVDPKNIYILIAIAAGVLLMACINFTTLAIGRSAGRAKEVGVRKVIGSGKKQLIFQFLSESLLLSIFSAALGLLLAYALLPLFNRLSQQELTFSLSQYPEMILLLCGLILLVGILSGSYPALVLSGFKPIEVLKNKIRLAGSNIFTKSLVTFQFVLSIGLIITTVIIMQQLAHMRDKNLGFSKENVLMIRASQVDTRKMLPLFKQELQSTTSILGITGSEMGLGAGEGQMGGRLKFPSGKVEGVIEYPVDPQFKQVMGFQLLAGRWFSEQISSDSMNAIVVNETLVKNYLNTTPDKAIGVQLTSPKRRDALPKTIIGVTKDFNFEDLKREVRAQLFSNPANFRPGTLYVRIRPGNPTQTIAKLQSTWKKLAPDIPFKFDFVDEKFDRFYASEQRWSNIIGWAGGVSIFLACLGLFGLAALAAVNRTKEIGIRKVLGASVVNIVRLLSMDFVKLVVIALLVASPLAWYFMNNWLQDFVYRIDIGYLVFILAGVFAIAIAIITIGVQAVRAAMSNPVNALRTE